MTDPPLGFGFAPMSALSERPPHAVAPDELLTEINDELAYRRTVYGRQVERSGMKPSDALALIETIEAIRDDLAFTYDAGTDTWPGRRIGWEPKVRELRRELTIRRNQWSKRVANPADPLDRATAARRMERFDAIHWRYWVEMFASDDLFTGDREARYDKIRAWHYVRWLWMRDLLKRGGRDALCVPPQFRQFADALRAQDPKALSIWHDYRRAAERNCMIRTPARATA